MEQPSALERTFELNFLTDLSEESLLGEVRRVASLAPTQVPFTKGAYKSLSPRVSLTTLRRRFGYWKDVLKAAGLDNRYSGALVTERMKLAPKHYSDADLIAELKRVYLIVDKEALIRSDYSAHSTIEAGHFVRHFGSFLKGLEAAGIKRHPKKGNEFTEAQCFENIANLWVHYGRAPQYRETLQTPSEVRAKTYVTRWSTWRKALAAFVEWSKNDQTQAEFTISISPSMERGRVNPRPRKSEADCRDVRPGLKYQTAKRDNFRCVACGRSPATHLHVELHADHIIAAANGGKTTLENLQTLCQDCNLGKGKSQ